MEIDKVGRRGLISTLGDLEDLDAGSYWDLSSFQISQTAPLFLSLPFLRPPFRESLMENLSSFFRYFIFFPSRPFVVGTVRDLVDGPTDFLIEILTNHFSLHLSPFSSSQLLLLFFPLLLFLLLLLLLVAFPPSPVVGRPVLNIRQREKGDPELLFRFFYSSL